METLRARNKGFRESTLILLGAAESLQRAGYQVDQEIVRLLYTTIDREWPDMPYENRDGEPQNPSTYDRMGHPDRPEITE